MLMNWVAKVVIIWLQNASFLNFIFFVEKLCWKLWVRGLFRWRRRWNRTSFRCVGNRWFLAWFRSVRQRRCWWAPLPKSFCDAVFCCVPNRFSDNPKYTQRQSQHTWWYARLCQCLMRVWLLENKNPEVRSESGWWFRTGFPGSYFGSAFPKRWISQSLLRKQRRRASCRVRQHRWLWSWWSKLRRKDRCWRV